jgi:5-methyltetrahydrofolate--homocysteine methyltransferase
MLIIGEKINTSLCGVEEAVKNRDKDFIQNLAKKQVNSGADVLDINVGTRIHSEVKDMKWMIGIVQEVVDVPLCVDSPRPEAVKVGLAECKGKAMVNSITAEKKRMEELLPLLERFGCKIIALTMDDRGIPEDIERRYEIADKLIRALTKAGISLSDIYIDPLVRPVSTDSSSGLIVLKSIKKIMSSFEHVHTICGLSNISFGLPARDVLNKSFLLLAMSMGLDSAILDPLDREMMAMIRAGEVLLGKDEYCLKYLTSFREGKF